MLFVLAPQWRQSSNTIAVGHSKSKAGWQSGYAAACKAVDAGSIPTPASISPSNKIQQHSKTRPSAGFLLASAAIAAIEVDPQECARSRYGTNCVVVAQHGKDNLVGVVLGEVESNQLKRLDFCIAPCPSSATRTGDYPK